MEQVEKVKQIIKKMYRNYGINVSEITEDEINRLTIEVIGSF